MANLLFHCDVINERGSTAALFEYISLCRDAGHNVTWAYSLDSPNNQKSLALVQEEFNTIAVSSVEKFARSAGKRFDWVYLLKKGLHDGLLIPGIPNSVHAIFQYYQPHGDSYAYISDWLARTMSRSQNKYIPARFRPYIPLEKLKLSSVPFSVNLPLPATNLRTEFGIPDEAKLCLRFGGMETFDIPWVKRILIESLDEDSNLWFLGVNTEKFTTHKRAVFAPPIFGLQTKADLIGSADFILHARRQGESFGMNILESMQGGKPILAWYGGWDRNHVALLDKSSLYFTPLDLKSKILGYGRNSDVQRNLAVGDSFRPHRIFPRFQSVFGHNVI